MPLRKRLLQDFNLYVILDAQVNSYRELLEIARRCVAAGVKIFQLRDKQGSAKDILNFAQTVLPFMRDRALFIINDRVDLAYLAGGSGVHLGQEDIPLKEARKILGKDSIIGISCQTVQHVLTAQQEGADYIGFGSIFKTATKPNRRPMDHRILREALRVARVPLFAIGGITQQNIQELVAGGVRRVAVCRSVCLGQNLEASIHDFQLQIKRKPESLRGSFNGRMSASQADNAGSIPVPRFHDAHVKLT